MPPAPPNFPPNQGQILAGFYADAAERLRKIVLEPSGMKQSTQNFRQARAAQLIQQVHQVQRGLDANASKWSGDNIGRSYKDGLRYGSKEAIQAGVPGPKVDLLKDSFTVINHQAVAKLANDTYQDLKAANAGMADQSVRALRKMAITGVSTADVNRILAGGIITGEPAQTSRELRDLFERIHGKTVVIVNKNGAQMHFEAKYYADMVARTRTREAVESARHDKFEQLDIDIVSIVGRPSKYFCSAYLGMWFSLSGRSSKYPALASLPSHGPPFHPNCSKSTRAIIPDLASAKQEEHSTGVQDADQLIGVDAATAQRRYQDLQLHAAVASRFPRNERPAA